MSKPKSMAVGNWLTLTEARTKLIPRPGDNTEYEWREMTYHKSLGLRRQVVAAKSKYVELGEQRSMLDYPKKTEYEENGSTLTITYKNDPTAGACGSYTRLVYTVETP